MFLPCDLREWVPQEHMVHFILDAVEQIPTGHFQVNVERATFGKTWTRKFARKVKKLELVNPQGFAGRARGCPRAWAVVHFRPMNWKRLLAYITGSVDQELLLRNEYLVTENRILKNQIKGRLQLTDCASLARMPSRR